MTMTSHWEFRQSFRRYIARYLIRIAGVFGLGALVFLALWLVLAVFDHRDGPTLRAEAAMTIAIVASLAAVVLSARSAEREARDDPQLICPHCDSPLAFYYGIIVLSSGNCPHCGEQVLED
jgi:hypothetical protein